MKKLLKGIQTFQSNIFKSKSGLFRELATGQNPSTLFITCSDSRVDPNLLTQTEPGEIFTLRNAGNLIPAAPSTGGEIATIEYAVVFLGIRDIVICGHSDCGAMAGLFNNGAMQKTMPSVYSWLENAKKTAEIVNTKYRHLSETERIRETIQQNVLVQMENLRTHRFIREACDKRQLKIHGWVYKFETGEVLEYSDRSGKFRPLLLDLPKRQHQEELATL
jgi:carbonic anhydrase